MKQEIYAVDFQRHPWDGLQILQKPTFVESWEGDFLTGIFPVSEQGYLIALGEGQVRFAKVLKVHKERTERGFPVEIERLRFPFRRGEGRRTE